MQLFDGNCVKFLRLTRMLKQDLRSTMELPLKNHIDSINATRVMVMYDDIASHKGVKAGLTLSTGAGTKESNRQKGCNC